MRVVNTLPYFRDTVYTKKSHDHFYSLQHIIFNGLKVYNKNDIHYESLKVD